jgi:hypothetical protein
MITLAMRRPATTLARAAIAATGTVREIVGPLAGSEVAAELLGVFVGELVRLVELLPGVRVPAIVATADAALERAYVAAGFRRLDEDRFIRGELG